MGFANNHRPHHTAAQSCKASFDVDYVVGKTNARVRALELSTEGLHFIADQKLPLKSELELCFRLDPGDRDPIVTRARVQKVEGREVWAEFVGMQLADRFRILRHFTRAATAVRP